MKKRLGLCALSLAAVAAVSLLAVLPTSAGGAANEVPLSIAKIIIEFNDTGQDVGIQVMLDGEPWRSMTGFGPNELPILQITGSRSVRRQGLTELFFESSEPSLDELPLAAFLARFPAGEYEFEGVTIDGEPIEGEAILTHVIPAGPEITSPVSPTEDPPVVDPDNLVIAWDAVTETIGGSDDITIKGYQLIVEQLEPRRVFSVDLPAAQTILRVPPEFFIQRNTLHKFEVLAIEEGGNQTITEGEFVTEP